VKLQELLSTAGETMTVRRVFAEPYDKDGVTIIPGAAVAGGGGGGGGHDEKGQQGEGGGFGMNAKPAGAFVIRSGRVRWQPAVDLNRLLMVVGAVAVTALLTRARRRQAGRQQSHRLAHRVAHRVARRQARREVRRQSRRQHRR
jgi:uncharacterized spore protein YtfJ